MAYFTFRELTHSETAFQNRIDNSIPCPRILSNLASIWNFLEELRSEFDSPIIVTSGYRSQALNKAVGGVPRSLHTQGRAVDIKTNPLQMEELSALLQEYYDKCCLSEFKKYPTYYHIAL